MTIELDLGGARRRVEVSRDAAGRWLVAIDGGVHVVEMTPAGPRWVLRMVPGGTDAVRAARVYDVAFDPAAGPELIVHVNGRAVPLVRPDRGAARRQRTEAPGGASAAQIVAAPMPGRIVRVLVAAGDRVEARQPLVVVEAMKMENELRAAAPGVVREVRVSGGTAVDRGAVLLVIESGSGA